MRFASPRTTRRPREAVVPMINVVFLLLIFFLMTASIAAPPPFEVSLPEARHGQETGTPGVLYIDKAGTLAFEDTRGEVALRVAAEAARDASLDIRADRETPAVRAVDVLRQLSALGVAETRLVTERP